MKKTMKKIAVLSAFAMVAGFAMNAQAGTFTVTPTNIATEIFGAGSAATVVTPAGSAVYTMAATPATGSAFNIVYTLTNGATWGAALTSGDCVYAPVGNGAAGTATVTLVGGGTTTDSTATFRVDVTNTLAATDTFTLTPTVKNATALAAAGGTVKIGVTLKDTLGNVDTAGAAAPLLTGVTGTKVTVAATTASSDLYIDVTKNSAKFTGTGADVLSPTAVNIGTIAVANVATMEANGTTTWATGGGNATNTTTITLTGDFAASLAVDADTDSTTHDGLYIDVNNNGAFNPGTDLPATTLTATTATWTITNQAAMAAADIVEVVDGTTPIGVGAASLSSNIVWANTTYATTATSGTLRNLQKNGGTAIANFALKPGGTFSNYIRISNTSSVDGKVYITLYEDDGAVSAPFALSQVDASYSDILKGQASTPALTIQKLFDASGLTAGYQGKLRVHVEGEFPTVNIQSFTLSLDGQTFNVF